MTPPNRSICVYCGKRADPRLDGRPKCMACMWAILAGFALSIAFLAVTIWSRCR